MKRSVGWLPFACLFAGLSCLAGDELPEAGLDSDSQNALEMTQKMLKDQKLRKEELKKSRTATEADLKVQALTPDEKKREEVYQVSSEIMGDLVRKTGGDPQKMNEILEESKKNPEGFQESLSEEQKQKIKSLSREISGERAR